MFIFILLGFHGKESPFPFAGDVGLNPDWGTMIPHAPEQLRLSAKTTEFMCCHKHVAESKKQSSCAIKLSGNKSWGS